MLNDNLERFYDDVVAGLHLALTRDSGGTGTLPGATDVATGRPLPTMPSQPGGAWCIAVPDPNAPKPPDRARPFLVPPWDGFQFVAIARLADVALVAFRWRETGEEIFVRTLSLRSFIDRRIPAELAVTIASMNLLEDLGGGWHLHVRTKRIGDLTFVG